jgi:two-component system chemotaxis response regulator CheY
MKKLLIVDDSAMQRKIVGNTFSKYYISELKEAGNGKDALDLLRIFDPDIVTMDITMPEMDGITCLEEMLKIKPELIVFVITALADNYTGLEALKKGAKNFFVKPINAEKLEKALNKLLLEA